MDYADSDHTPAKLTRPPRGTDRDRTRPAGVRRPPTCRPILGPIHRDRITTIITDIDGVLLTFEPHILAGIEQHHGLPAGQLHHVLHERPSAQAARIGLLDEPTWLHHARQSLPARAVDAWLDYHGSPNQAAIDLLRLARQAGLGILVVGNGTRRRHRDLAHHHLYDLADHVYLSADIGRAKPDPAAWAHALHRSGTDPAQTLTIDTHPAWVDASDHLGMHAHQYVDAERLRRALTRAGARR